VPKNREKRQNPQRKSIKQMQKTFGFRNKNQRKTTQKSVKIQQKTA